MVSSACTVQPSWTAAVRQGTFPHNSAHPSDPQSQGALTTRRRPVMVTPLGSVSHCAMLQGDLSNFCLLPSMDQELTIPWSAAARLCSPQGPCSLKAHKQGI